MPDTVRAQSLGTLRKKVGYLCTYPVLKRGLDILVAGTALVLLSPLLLAIGLLVRATSRGPALFVQSRVTGRSRDGRWESTEFRFLKFRTMYVQQGHDLHQRFVTAFIQGDDLGMSEAQTGDDSKNFKLSDDPRVTGPGRILRKLSLDELPQLWNVLRGEMSLVGPRPPLPYEVELYDQVQMKRLEVKPGMTGLWQINGRSSTTFDEMVRLDLDYIEHRNLWMDVCILFKTIPVVISARGVE